jgi:hypothetical protein
VWSTLATLVPAGVAIQFISRPSKPVEYFADSSALFIGFWLLSGTDEVSV